MGQIEVYELLKRMRKKNDSFHTAKEICEILRRKGLSLGATWDVPGNLNSLEQMGYLESEIRYMNPSGRHKGLTKTYRLKLKYIKN